MKISQHLPPNQSGNAEPWPDVLTGVRRFAYALFFSLIGLGMVVSGSVNQRYLTSPVDNSGEILLAGIVPMVVFLVIIAWNGPVRKRGWVFACMFTLCWLVLLGSLLGQALFWLWAARLSPPFYFSNPAYVYNWPELTFICFAMATVFSAAALIIGYLNRWFQGLW